MLGYTVILCNSNNDPEKEEKLFQLFEKKRIDGIILASYTAESSRIQKIQKKMPIVLIDNITKTKQSVTSFIAKNREGSRMAVSHLIDQGCRKIAHICGPFEVFSARERFLGYEDICHGQPWFLPSLVVQGEFQIDTAYRATIDLIRRHPDVDGIFAGNDMMAVGAIRALAAIKRKVPEDVKIVGFDGIFLPLAVPELTTVAQPIAEMGALAMRHLVDLIHEKPVEQEVHYLDVELVVRESSTAV